MLVQTDSSVQIEAAGDSHVGLVRKENQDRHDSFLSPFGEVHIVADGMGGHRGGATAAAMVVDGYHRRLTELPASMDYRDALREATRRTNDEISDLGASGKPEYSGMGSTVVLALLRGRELVVGHIGDSRAYLYRGGRLIRLTKDHTAVQQLVDCGVISEAEARNHPHSSLLIRALGQVCQVELDLSEPVPLEDGDCVLLCSDGLSGRVQDGEIEAMLCNCHANARAVAHSLVELGLNAGGSDNITVRCVRVGPHEKPPAKRWFRRLFNGS